MDAACDLNLTSQFDPLAGVYLFVPIFLTVLTPCFSSSGRSATRLPDRQKHGDKKIQVQRQGRLAHFAEAAEGPGSSACHAPPNAWNTATRCGVYRATLCGNSTPILRVEPNRSGTLVLSGQAGAHYTIEQKSGLQANAAWGPLTNLTLVTTNTSILGLPLTNTARFFRAVGP